MHDDTMDRLRAEPNFVAALQRLAEAQSQKCRMEQGRVGLDCLGGREKEDVFDMF